MEGRIFIEPIGKVKVNEEGYLVEIDAAYRSALTNLDQFSHALIFWWAHQNDRADLRRTTMVDLPYARGTRAGVFACRSQIRPNPIAVTTCALLHVDVANGIVIVPWIDAFDGTPLIDIKPFMPTSDRVRDFHVAPWAEDWPEWMEDAGLYFQEHAVDFGD